MVGPAIFGVVRDCLKMMKMGDTRKVAEKMEHWMSHGIVGFCPYFSTHLGLQNDPGYWLHHAAPKDG